MSEAIRTSPNNSAYFPTSGFSEDKAAGGAPFFKRSGEQRGGHNSAACGEARCRRGSFANGQADTPLKVQAKAAIPSI